MFDNKEYDLIIDARSPREFEEDHIPGAVNLPVVNNDEYAEVGTLYKSDKHAAYLIGVAHSLRNMADAIDGIIKTVPEQAKIGVYCFRGGKRSQLWANALTTVGYRVERLEGGWKAYRAWVRRQLEELPGRFSYNVLCGPTGCGKTRLLYALQEAGAQVLDLEAIAAHRGSLIGAIPGVSQPPQKLFDSYLVERLLQLDPLRSVWLEAESKKIGEVQLPDALFKRMHTGRCVRLESPIEERVKLWREDYSHWEKDPQALLLRLRYVKSIVGGDRFQAWEQLAAERRIPELFESLMLHHYDPAYGRSTRRNYAQLDNTPVITASSLSAEALAHLAQSLLANESARCIA